MALLIQLYYATSDNFATIPTRTAVTGIAIVIFCYNCKFFLKGNKKQEHFNL